MTIAIYWFRSDLRLRDNPAFTQACKDEETLLPIFINQAHLTRDTVWGFPRINQHRKVFLQESFCDLREQLRMRGSDLFEMNGDSLQIFQDYEVNLI